MKKVASYVGGAVVLLTAAALSLAFWAPVYLLMSHHPRDTSALFGTLPQPIAHRGWSADAPENTLAAFSRAAASGYWMELDVTLAKTGEIVVIHDDTVDRTTNGTGAVSDLSWDELSALDAGRWFDSSFAGEPLPTLDRVFADIPLNNVILVEMKTADDKVALPTAVAAAIARAGRQDRVIVISFDPYMLEQLRLIAPEILRGQLVGDYADSDLTWYQKRALQNLALTSRVQQDVVLWQHDLLDQTLVDRLKGKGYAVFAWTVNQPTDLERVKALGVTGILSDHPDRI